MTKELKPFPSLFRVQANYLLFLPYFNKEEKKRRDKLLCVSIALRIFGYLTFVVPCMFHIWYIKTENINIDVTENYIVIIGGFFTLLADSVFPFFSNKWKILVDKIIDYKIFGKPMNAKKTVEFFYKAVILYNFLLLLGSFLYLIFSSLQINKCLELNEKLGKNLICICFVNFWLPIKINIQMQLIIFFLQFIITMFVLNPAALIGFIVWETSTMICLHFEHLTVTIKQIIKIKDFNKRQKLLRLWIFYHLQIFRLIKDYNHLTKICLGTSTMVGSVTLALIMNQLISMYKPLGASFNLLGWLITLYLLCKAGQIIEDGTLSISLAIYNTNWYDVDIKTQKDLLFILQRSQKPVNLDALPLGVLGCELMLTILKTAYSYLTLLSNTSNVTK